MLLRKRTVKASDATSTASPFTLQGQFAMTIIVRPEKKSDREIIWELTKLAFSGKPYAGGNEQDLIDNLRELNVLSASLVAVDGSEVVGQITFSPASISSGEGNWYALGPISVLPHRQSEGIGGLLIEAGMKVIEHMGAWGCILTGNPDYYSRHGFTLANVHCPDNEAEEYFMLRLSGVNKPVGKFAFHDAFYTGA